MALERTKIRIQPGICFAVAIAFLLLPLRWIFGWTVASFVHELFHYLAIRFYRGDVTCVTLGTGGAQMETTPLESGAQCICALAGPVGGALLLLFAQWLPVVALCAAVQTAFNLLPVYPLDGGRMAEYIVRCFVADEVSNKILGLIEITVILGVITIGVYAAFALRLGFLPLGIACFLAIRHIGIKRTCKAEEKWVQ